MSKARRKGFTDGASGSMDIEDYQEKGYKLLSTQYDVTMVDIERVVNEVFSEVPEERCFFFWTEQHKQQFDRAIKEYLKEQGYE